LSQMLKAIPEPLTTTDRSMIGASVAASRDKSSFLYRTQPRDTFRLCSDMTGSPKVFVGLDF
jgi:hypothetical protein